jgi:hypothetical protein
MVSRNLLEDTLANEHFDCGSGSCSKAAYARSKWRGCLMRKDKEPDWEWYAADTHDLFDQLYVMFRPGGAITAEFHDGSPSRAARRLVALCEAVAEYPLLATCAVSRCRGACHEAVESGLLVPIPADEAA